MKLPAQQSDYDRVLQRCAEEYRANHPGPVTLLDIAEWMINTGRWEQKKARAVKELMRHLAQALRGVKVRDENGEPVRVYHAFPASESQGFLWAPMPELSNDQMKASLQCRSSGAFGVVKQIHRDQNHFNKNHNTGDPIQLSFNYDARLEDTKHSTEYVDHPPPGDDADGADLKSD